MYSFRILRDFYKLMFCIEIKKKKEKISALILSSHRLILFYALINLHSFTFRTERLFKIHRCTSLVVLLVEIIGRNVQL